MLKYILISALLFSSVSISQNVPYNTQGANFMKGQQTGTLSAYLYTSDDSTAVINYFAYLLDSNMNKIDSASSRLGTNKVQFFNVPTPVGREDNPLPSDYSVFNNFPNPFNPHTTIRYELPQSGNVQVGVYDLGGSLVKMIVNENQGAGQHDAVFDGKNGQGEQIAQGVYFGRVVVDGKPIGKTLKMVYLHGVNASQVGSGEIPNNQNDSQINTKNPAYKGNSLDYIIQFKNLTSTVPQVNDAQQFISFSGDTSINAYAQRWVHPTGDISLASLVQMLSGFVLANLRQQS